MYHLSVHSSVFGVFMHALLMIVALGMVMMIAPLGVDIFLPSLPVLAQDIGVSIDEAEGSIAVFIFTLGLGQLIFGPLSDLYGRRVVIFVGLTIFAFSNLFASFTSELGWLYLWRGLQGLGASASVAGLPFARDRYSGNKANQIISAIMAFTLLAPVTAPFLGNYLTTQSGWPSIFVFLWSFSIAALAMMIWLQSVMRDEIAQNPIERPSLVQICRIYRSILSDKDIILPSLVASFGFGGLFAFIAGASFVYLEFYAISPWQFSFLLAVIQIGHITSNLINMVIPATISPLKRFIWITPLLTLMGFITFVASLFNIGPIGLMIIMTVYFFTFGLSSINVIAHILSIRPEDNGSIIAVNGALRFLIGSIAALIVSAIAATNAVPMTAVIAVFCGVGMGLFFWCGGYTKSDKTSP